MSYRHSYKPRMLSLLFAFSLVLFFGSFRSYSSTVTALSAQYRNGQVFLTWNNPSGKNLQYNLYRSASQITNSSQLTTTNFLGFVQDSSSKNIRMSMLTHVNIYFQITDGGAPLSAGTGVYVTTCFDSQSYYYAVTVTDLSSGIEDRSVLIGDNSLYTAVQNHVSIPQPVFQYTETWKDSENVDRYVQFGDNQETPSYPALNSIGSYGFNFYVLKRGTAVKYPIIALYEGLDANSINSEGLGDLANQTIENCYILGFDDWLPIAEKNGMYGDNTYFCCYHENFNIYTDNNPIPDTGVVKMFPQHRYIAAIRWAKKALPVDTSKIYTLGTSAGGFGAALTAVLIPNEIAAVYAVVEPLSPNSSGVTLYEEMWGDKNSNLNSDVVDWRTSQPLLIKHAKDLTDMVSVNEQLPSVPLIYDIHGKNDVTVAWSDKKVAWYDSLQANEMGGVFYWDQRTHGGQGANFTDTETTPDFSRYYTTKSYPAFSNCSINQDPGNGNKSDGDPYGAINGYLDWNDNITDKTCNYSVKVFIKDFYAGGVLYKNQYDTCTTDITLRRLQNFKPSAGQTIKWKNLDNTDKKIQSGSFVYSGGIITLRGMKVNRSVNTIKLNISGCSSHFASRDEDDDIENTGDQQVFFAKSPSGYLANVEMDHSESAFVTVYDVMGRIVFQNKLSLTSGTNTFEIKRPNAGIYLVRIKGNSFSNTTKLLF